MSNNPRFIMIGGFLGAGKTTTVGQLAKHYQSQGLRVGIVTNDQATDLVDTNLLRAQGFEVGEVAGSCFCCNFDELTRTMEGLSEDQRPDVMIAEPVGSCTDLVATVLRPLQQIYEQPFDIAPYGVILKPSHGIKILKKTGKGGFSPQAEYIFRKQVEEADFVIINRIDELTPEAIQELRGLLQSEYPQVPVLCMSATTGQGIADLIQYIEGPAQAGVRAMEVDYDVYAVGEAELGWLNAQVALKSAQPFELDPFLLRLLSHIQHRLQDKSAEVAHLKAIGMEDGYRAVANGLQRVVPQLSIGSQAQVNHLDLRDQCSRGNRPRAIDRSDHRSITSDESRRAVGDNGSHLASVPAGTPRTDSSYRS
ncbi:MAG: GTP-binding protein [Pirellulales bacterium]